MCGDSKLHHWPDFYFPREETRLSNPPKNLKGIGINRWQYLYQNPQERTEITFDYNISSRDLARDNHRPCIPTPISQEPGLPKGGVFHYPKINQVCGAITEGYEPGWQKDSTICKY